MKWEHKALIQRTCARMPGGAGLYRFIQKRFGTLNSTPTDRFPVSIEMIRWLHDAGVRMIGSRCLEVGTGHKATLPLVFFIAGAESVVTIDLNRRLDMDLMRGVVRWFVENREVAAKELSFLRDPEGVESRLRLIQAHADSPETLMKKAGITYLAPADAADTGLPPQSTDIHFSTDVFEHIPIGPLTAIVREARRVIRLGGAALHFINPTDHFAHQDARIPTNHFLKYEAAEWDRIAGNEFGYCNRARPRLYRELFTSTGWRLERVQETVDPGAAKALAGGLEVAEEFHGLPEAELCCANLKILARPLDAQL